jgi:hypothetical protein
MHCTNFDKKDHIQVHGTDVPVEEPSTASTGDIEMKRGRHRMCQLCIFLPPTLAMVASRVIGQLQRAYPHPGLTL